MQPPCSFLTVVKLEKQLELAVNGFMWLLAAFAVLPRLSVLYPELGAYRLVC